MHAITQAILSHDNPAKIGKILSILLDCVGILSIIVF
jgi:hypothetical protein